MSAPGTVLFSASSGYDADMWDDSALIRQYDRALQSSKWVQYSTVQYSTVQYNTVQYSTVQHSTVPYSSVKPGLRSE